MSRGGVAEWREIVKTVARDESRALARVNSRPEHARTTVPPERFVKKYREAAEWARRQQCPRAARTCARYARAWRWVARGEIAAVEAQVAASRLV